MTGSLSFLAPVGRVLLALIFILSGFGKLSDPTAAAAYIESGGLPGLLVWPTILVEIGGGALVAFGLFTRPASIVLAAFTVVAGLLYHFIPSQSAEGMEAMTQMIQFQKNLSITGGLLFLAAMGPGAWALGGEHTSLSRA